MSMRLLPKEPIMLRDTSAQDRVIEPKNPFQAPSQTHHGRRHRRGPAASLLIVILMRYSGAGVSVDRSRVSIATVERGNFVRDIAADGQVVAAVSPTLYANALGTVTLKVHAGDTVTKGQVLAVVDSPDLTAKLSQEEATLASLRLDWQRATLDAEHKLSQLRDAYNQAEVDQKTAQRERDRSRKAYELGSYSELQALRAEDALEKAQFAFQQAKSTYDEQPKQNRFDIDSKKALLDRQQFMVSDLQRQVDGLNVKSPVDGQVGQVQVADRASVAKDAPLLTVVDLSALEVEIKVTESLARDLRPGMTRRPGRRRPSLAGRGQRRVARGRRRPSHRPAALRRGEAGGLAAEPAPVGAHFPRPARQRADGRSRLLRGSGGRRFRLCGSRQYGRAHAGALGRRQHRQGRDPGRTCRRAIRSSSPAPMHSTARSASS